MLLITFTGLKLFVPPSGLKADILKLILWGHIPGNMTFDLNLDLESYRGARGGQQWGEVVKMRRWRDKSSGYGSGHGSVGGGSRGKVCKYAKEKKKSRGAESLSKDGRSFASTTKTTTCRRRVWSNNASTIKDWGCCCTLGVFLLLLCGIFRDETLN